MKELYKCKGFELASLLKKKEVSSKEILQSFINQIEKKEKFLSSYITLDLENALKKAEELDIKRIKGEDLSFLAGIPVAVKDNISTKGLLTTCGSKMLCNYIPVYDAFAVKCLKESEMIILGKTNMDEFAMGSTGENSYFGVTKNPRDIKKVAGGSSSGSAAAILSGEAPFSLGTDTGGSIRLPASYCGIVGLKPTYGAVSRNGLIPFASGYDVIGPMGRCVKDVSLLSQIIYKYDNKDMTCKNFNFDFSNLENYSLKGKKIAVIKELFNSNIISSDVLEKVNKALKIIENMGGIIEEISLPEIKDALWVYYIISSAQASSNLSKYDGIRFGFHPDEDSDIEKIRTNAFGTEVKRRIILGTYILSSSQYEKYYQRAVNMQNQLIEKLDKIFDKFDFIITPTSPRTAHEISEKVNNKNIYDEDICTVFASVTGIPSISLPCGVDSSDMPVGIEISSKKFSDHILLKMANALEKEIGFDNDIV
ncbi:MAG: Asp-tRNA(Asn)/Glu-tRNA(Gln) amidotransferase subunit GatA [Clostridia bacterium]|nr:Asp-tRNA(Asn)/Glu-tRNA(Gln) amidotransferase subunit GatA [Clostridia bacterium]